MKSPSLSYKDAGVNIEEGDALVEAIKPFAKATKRPGVMGGIGGFGALFDLKPLGYKDPVLVSGTDGVGTKLHLAIASGIHHTIGIDLVAMCVNDLLVQGAEPLFFLDYFATGKLENKVAARVIEGIATGCKLAGAALIGGETAEMPGLYQEKDYDLAGFAVGAVERDAILPRSDIAEGDMVLGIPSSGVHSNGFSLVRKIIERSGLALDQAAPFDPQQSVAEAFLTPTRIYCQLLLPLIRSGKIKALAHITGGGLTDNIPRILPEACRVNIDLSAWELPPVFKWLYQEGAVDPMEMLRVFNVGIGMVIIVTPEEVASVVSTLEAAGEKPITMGKVEPYADHAVHYQHSERMFG